MSGVVVVTGAGAGVGRATVEEFARHGYDVALRAKLEDLMEPIGAHKHLLERRLRVADHIMERLRG